MDLTESGYIMKKLSKNVKIMIIVLAALAAALLVTYFIGAWHFASHFFPGTTMNGVDCGGKTVAEVKEALQDSISDYTLTLQERDGQTETISGLQLDMQYVDQGEVDDPLERQASRPWILSISGNKTYHTNADFTYDDAKLDTVMDQLECFQADKVTSPQDAYISDNGTSFEIVAEVEGNTLDRDKTKEALAQAIEEEQKTVDLEALDLYEKPEVLSTDESLQADLAQMNQLTSANIVYDFQDRQMTVDRTTIASWLVKGEDGTYDLDQEQVAAWVKHMAYETDTFGLEHQFTTSTGVTITLAAGGDYGWVIDKDATTEALIQMVKEGQQTTVEPVYLYQGKDRSVNDIGDTYVEVCIATQTMWCYKDGELVVETPVVTGNDSTGFQTPSGSVWAIDAKKADAQFTLFDVKVAFWLPFNGDCGIHDMTSRTEFGGDIYLTNGSHGCVNTPYEAAEKIFNAMEIGDPVIVYYSTDQVVGPQPTQDVSVG